jgi:hypothetical protein
MAEKELVIKFVGQNAEFLNQVATSQQALTQLETVKLSDSLLTSVEADQKLAQALGQTPQEAVERIFNSNSSIFGSLGSLVIRKANLRRQRTV